MHCNENVCIWYEFHCSLFNEHSCQEVSIGSCNDDLFIDHDVIKWKHFPRYWPFVRGIHRSPVNSLHKGQWRGALMFSLICARINGLVNNVEAGDLRRHRAHYDVIVMCIYASSRLISKHVSFKSYRSSTLWGRDKTAANSQTTFSNEFSWMKMNEFRLTLNVWGPSKLGLTRSISWLLMPWLLVSPGH